MPDVAAQLSQACEDLGNGLHHKTGDKGAFEAVQDAKAARAHLGRHVGFGSREDTLTPNTLSVVHHASNRAGFRTRERYSCHQ